MLRPATLLLIALFACGPAAASDRDPLAGAVPIEAVAAGLPSLDDLSGRTLQHAVDAFSRGELRAARGELRTLLDRQRVVGAERVQAHFLLGWISTQMGHHQQASANFYRVRKLEQHPLRELAAFYEARADLNRGHPRTAIAECEQYRTEYPEGRFVEECALVSAESHLALGQLKIAIDDLKLVSSFERNKLSSATAVQLEGLWLQGCEFDGKQLTDIRDQAGSELVAVPPCHIGWIGQSEAGPYPEHATVETPIYLSLDREAMLCTLQVPNHGNSSSRILAGVALFLNGSDM